MQIFVYSVEKLNSPAYFAPPCTDLHTEKQCRINLVAGVAYATGHTI